VPTSRPLEPTWPAGVPAQPQTIQMRDILTADATMIEFARKRQQVLFLGRDNIERLVTLICWKGKAGRLRCRIEHPSGKQATVPTSLIKPAANLTVATQ
jgi:hypothetical protein